MLYFGRKCHFCSIEKDEPRNYWSLFATWWSFDFLLTSYIHAGDWLIPKQIGSLPEQILLLAPTEIRLGKTTRSRVDCGIGARCYILQIHRSGRISIPLTESSPVCRKIVVLVSWWSEHGHHLRTVSATHVLIQTTLINDHWCWSKHGQ